MERRVFLFHILLSLLLSLPIYSLSGQDDDEMERLRKEGIRNYNEGDFAAAERSFRSMLLIDSTSIKARNNLGILFKNLGRYNDALAVYFEAEGIIRRQSGQSSREMAKLYNNIGNVYNERQDFELALQYLNFAEKIFRDAGIRNDTANVVYTNIGNSYYGMNEWRKALGSYQLGIEAKLSSDKKNLDRAYANCAAIYVVLEELDSASIYYKLSIQEKINNAKKETYTLIPTYVNYGELLEKMGKMSEAFHYFSRALELAEDRYDGKHPDIAVCHAALANWYLECNEIDKALEHFQKGLSAVVFDFDSTDIYVNPSLENEIMSESGLLAILLKKSVALESKYQGSGEQSDLLASLETLELANNLAEKMRSSYLGEGSKLLITGYARSGFDRTIQTAYELYKLSGDRYFANKAFTSAEKSKSSVLLASLQEVERKKNLGIPVAMQDYERSIKKETEILKKKLYEESQRPAPDQFKLEKWQEQLFYLSQQLDSIDNVIREQFPEYASKYDNEVIDLDGVMQKLKRDEVLIEYSLGKNSLFIFLVTPKEFRILEVSVDSVFLNQVGVLGQFLRDNNFASNTYDDYQAYVQAAYYLYEVFLKPLEDDIQDKRLLIIPDGELGYIPFEALLTSLPKDGGMDYRSLPYLIYKNRTNYSYSATLYFAKNPNRKKAGKNLIAFAPTYENINDISSEKFPAYRDYSTYLVPLRFISTEIQNISEIIESDKFEAYNATEKAFKENAPDYNVLHLAMHTLLNDENPLYSKLVFTMNNDTLEENDGLLHAYEIFNLQLNARMAVLSACNTGYGKLQRGEGVMSMARGFIFAGVPSIIMTLWAVEDQSGSILMSKFYNNLVEGMHIDEALQEAKLQYLSEADQLGAHPYLWSGYVSIGSTDPIVHPSKGIIYWIGGGAVILLLITLFIILRLRRKKRA